MKINFTNTTNTIAVERMESLYLIPVELDDLHIPFVFDTGATMTVMNKTTATRFKAIPSSETVKGGGNARQIFSANTEVIPLVHIGEVTIEDLHVIVVEDEQLDFGETENGNHLIVNGFLGWDIIQHFKWQYDRTENCITMSKPIKEVVPSNLEEWDNMPIIRTLINSKEVLFGFDTGNTESILGDRMYNRLSKSSEVLDVFTGVDGNTEETVRIVENFTLQIGKQMIVLDHVSAIDRKVFPTENEQINGLLGADILEGRGWTLDYSNRFLEIN